MAKFNPYKAARARVAAERRAARTQEVYDKRKYGVTGPQASALARIEAERRAAQNRQAYNQARYGQDRDPDDVAQDRAGVARGLGMMGQAAGIPGAGGAANIAAGAAMGGPVGAVVAATMEMIKATRSMIQDATRNATKYSPIAAQAQAQADVRGMYGDLREARALGDGIAKLVDAQSRAQDTMRQLLLPIKKVVVEVIARVMEFIADRLKEFQQGLITLDEFGKAALEALVQAIQFNFEKANDIVNDIPNRIKKALQELKDQDKLAEEDPFLAGFLAMKVPEAPPVPLPRPVAAAFGFGGF